IKGNILVADHLELFPKAFQERLQPIELVVQADRKTDGRVLDQVHFEAMFVEELKKFTDALLDDKGKIQGGKFEQDLVPLDDKTGHHGHDPLAPAHRGPLFPGVEEGLDQKGYLLPL